MENLPIYISIVFSITTLLTVLIFFRAARNATAVLVILLAWILLQAIVASTGFYTNTYTTAPRLMRAVIPALVLIILLFITGRGKRFLDSLNLETLTLLHTIRIPVELVLFWLFINKKVPGLMTFEGRNLDILSGITAPLICYLVFAKGNFNKWLLLVWNFCCLGLLINIVTIAILSAPFNFQQLAFEQPDIAIFYFPFIWLPCCVVPLVLLSHLAAIRQLLKKIINK